jgi:hypothetical protein
MPFHSTATEEEAEMLLATFAALGYDGVHRIRPTWGNDIMAAMRTAAERFGLESMF